VGRPRSIDRARLLQFNSPAAEILEESSAVAEEDGECSRPAAEDIWRMAYVRWPEGITVALAQRID
jgi:hypothetical protein